MIAAAAGGGVTLKELWLCSEMGADPEAWHAYDAPVFTVPPSLFTQLAYRRHPDGHLAVAEVFSVALERLDLDGAGLVLVVDGTEKPGNLGAMMRTAEAFAVDAVIASDTRTDLFNPNVLRASMGALFRIPVAAAGAAAVRAALQAAELCIVPTSRRGARSLWDVDLTLRVAIIVGSEERGLAGEWAPGGPGSVTIPTPGGGSPLNVSVATAVALAEAVRQRRSIVR